MARTKKRVEQSGKNNDIVGIILITISIIIAFSILKSSSGILVSVVNKIIFLLMGVGAYIIPILLFFIGILYIINRGRISFGKRYYAILLLIANTLLFVQMINMKLYYSGGDLVSGIIKMYYSESVFHGGIVAYIVDVPLFKLLGPSICYTIFISTYLICAIIIFDISIYDIASKIKMNKAKKDDRKIIKQKNMISEKKLIEEPKDGEDGFIANLNRKIKVIDFMKSNDLKDEKNGAKDDVLVQDDIKVSSFEDKYDKDKKIDDDTSNEEISRVLEQTINSSNLKEKIEYSYPPVLLLNQNNSVKMNKEDKKDLLGNASKLEETLSSFGVEAKVIQVTKGPSVTRFELQPKAGVKVSKIVNLSDDIALSLAAKGVRIEAPIPGKAAVGIEVPNKELAAVFLREVIESEEFVNAKKNLAFGLGKDIAGNCVVTDLTKMPHLLIAGATGSGKSVCINTLIISLIYKYSPNEVRMLMIDPKVVELNVYNGIPHLLIPVVTEPKKAAGALSWAVNEMTRRYKLFAENGARNIEGYNELVNRGVIEEKLPCIVIIVDELADLMMVCPNDVEDYIGRLAQMARAAGMHLVIATQRPSVDVITGVIKANIPSRISFAVSSQIDSRTILDSAGAEKLLGKGDMLFHPVGESKPVRIQGAFISEEEVEKVVEFIKDSKNPPEYKTEILEVMDNAEIDEDEEEKDELFDEATKIVIDIGQASTSLIQRKLRIGYNRAARIIDQLEYSGIISSRDGSKPRQILVDRNRCELTDCESIKDL